MFTQRFVRRLSSRAARHRAPETRDRLKRPKTAVFGGPDDVKSAFPFLHDLSMGAQTGTPAWVPAQPVAAGNERTPRNQSASWLEITYPFGSDSTLRNRYRLTDSTSLRVGMFLEELDAFSADCAFRHIDGFNPERPLRIVTAAHDNIHFVGGLSAEADLRLRGAVVNVGTSSIEVRTDVYQVSQDNSEDFIGACYTLMVARNVANTKSAWVHPLLEAGDLSADTAAEAALRTARRRRLSSGALVHKPPAADEVPLLHELWRTSRAAESIGALGRKRMAQSEQRALDIMQPRHQNCNNAMFGGYLLRRALELAWLAAYRFCRQPAAFEGLDDVVFKKPVEVGVLLEYVARVVFVAPDCSLRVFVEAHKLDLATDRTEVTNEFHFVFRALSQHPADLHEVQPETYEEGMLYLEGRRRWLLSTKASAAGMESGTAEPTM